MSTSSESGGVAPADAPLPGMPEPARPAPKPLALSASRASDYRQCPLLYRFRAIDRLPEPKSRAQVLGTTVHTALENLYQLDKQERTVDRAVALAAQEADTAVAEGGIAADVIEPGQARAFREDATTLVRGLYVVEDPTRFDPHSCEGYFAAATAAGTPLHGFVDRIDIAPTGEVRVVDYKTGKRPRPEYEDGAKSQMRFYALMYQLVYGEIPTQLKLIYLKTGTPMILQPTAQMLERTAEDLDRLWSQIETDGESGEFDPRTSRLCDWCAHRAVCPAYGGTPPEYPGWPGTRQVTATGPGLRKK